MEGELCWAKIQGFPPWPAQLIREGFASAAARKAKQPGTVLLRFFGDGEFGCVACSTPPRERAPQIEINGPSGLRWRAGGVFVTCARVCACLRVRSWYNPSILQPFIERYPQFVKNAEKEAKKNRVRRPPRGVRF